MSNVGTPETNAATFGGKLNAEAGKLVKKYRGNPEKLATWKKVARVLNNKGYRTERGQKFTPNTARQYAEASNLAIDYSSKGSYKRKGNGGESEVYMPAATAAAVTSSEEEVDYDNILMCVQSVTLLKGVSAETKVSLIRNVLREVE